MRSSRRGTAGRSRPAYQLIAGFMLAAALVGGFAIEASGGDLPSFMSAENRQLRDRVNGDAPDLAPVYEARRYQPIWVEGGKVRPEARTLIAAVASAEQDGLDPERYGLAELKQELALAQTGKPAALARFEMHASRAFVDYVLDLHTPKGEEMIYTDPAAAPPPMTRLSVLQAVSEAPSLRDHLVAVRRMNPIYEDLRRALAVQRARSGPASAEQLLLLNLDRARALPANPGRRYIVVDSAAAMLWMYENGRPVDSMKVIVGKRHDPTPLMAGMIRYALFNPYWNVPEDIVRESLAPQVLSGGTEVIKARQMEALSDWTANARVLDPAAVDWHSVAAGRQYLRVRQVPGPTNMMGKVKFMLPNELGIYLHDTPNKAHFTQEDRWFSAGCVRLEDADRLARWLFGEHAVAPTPDYRLNLREPVPVYMTYFTAAPSPAGVQVRRDIYGWDSVSLATRQAKDLAA